MDQADKSREHLANERTFLAWVRTGITIMAFGFAVAKFSLFTHQVELMFAVNGKAKSEIVSDGLGVVLVAFGLVISLLGLVEYRITRKQLEQGAFRPSRYLPAALITILMLIGILLIALLVFV